MIIEPKTRGFFCLSAHPDGCAENVRKQAEYAALKAKKIKFSNALIVGASTGYGLASRIALGLGASVPTLGVFFEREAAPLRTASAGWYNTAAFSALADGRGIYAESVNGDAFSEGVKSAVAELVRRDFGKLDLLVYSVAAPRRTVPGGITYNSVIKPIGRPFRGKTIDLKSDTLKEVEVLPASEEEIVATIKVMGGEDWSDWVEFLRSRGLLSDKFETVAYSYVGPSVTYPVYRDGTIGEAKKHLEHTAEQMRINGVEARIAVNKAVVTQAGTAIPVVPLYMSALMRVMKDRGVHEGCIEQICRLFFEKWGDFDSEGRMRVDDFELSAEVQQAVNRLWNKITDENLTELTDAKGYRSDFLGGFGFGIAGVDYSKDVDPKKNIRRIVNVN